MPAQYRVEKWTGDSAPSASELKRLMESEGFSVFQWEDPPGAYYSPHVHPDEQSHWIVSGTLELDVIGVGTFRLSAGDRDLMPPETEHSATVIGDEPAVYLIGSK
jgi:quercetin dioxygenase-like cupin family protein